MRRSRSGCIYIYWLLGLLIISVPARAEYSDLKLISGTTLDTSTDGDSAALSFSSDGNLVVFSSSSSNLVNNDTNQKTDVFLRNISSGTTTLISLGQNNFSAAGDSHSARISADGSTVVFISDAPNLVDLDSNNAADVFSYDVGSTEISRISIATSLAQANAASLAPALSSDGRYVVFVSSASNLVDNDTNGFADIFRRDTTLDTTEIISRTNSFGEANGASGAPAISSDGSLIFFPSSASNLVNNDSNSLDDIFVWQSGPTISLITKDSLGGPTNGNSAEVSCSADGRYVVFSSQASDIVSDDTNSLTDIFWVDRNIDSRERVSLGADTNNPNGASSSPSVSDNGRYIAFTSNASNLISSDTNQASDIFVYDRSATASSRVSVNVNGLQANKASSLGVLAADAQFLIFNSLASDLLPADTNDKLDIYRINLECLVDLGSSPSTDTDSDSILDCDEDCGADANKSSPGVCGCGVSDADSDSDSSLDCNDGCPTDPLKTSLGVCGCSVSDADANGNQVADCLDPTSSSVPRAALVFVNHKKRRVTINFPGDFSGVTYRFSITKSAGSRVLRSGSTSRTKYKLSLKRGRYSLSYTVSLGGILTQSSSSTTFRVR